MTMLPEPSAIKLGLVIDLDICVGCQGCVVNCKEWNTAGYGAPLADEDAYGAAPMGAGLNRVHAYEVSEGAGEAQISRTVHFPKSCLHCEDAPRVAIHSHKSSLNFAYLSHCPSPKLLILVKQRSHINSIT